jgi:hypothetical protein
LQALETPTAATQQGRMQTQSHKTEHAHAGSK